MKVLITGGCGFLGSNLAQYAISKNYEVIVVDNLYRLGSKDNLQWLKNQGKFKFVECDVRNFDDISKVIKDFKPDAIFHLAGQVAMTTSIANPRLDFEVNALGTFNVLESIRQFSKDSSIVYSSTNKVYGDLEQFTYIENETRYSCKEKPFGFAENITLNFHSPYGCSKGTADQYILDYSRIFSIKAVVFRHSSMFGTRQFATFDQGWIGWFCQKAVETKLNKLKEPFTISGNGKQVRDVLYAQDMVNLYYKCIENIDVAKGNAFNIGGGFDNSLSLLELFDFLEKSLDIKLDYKKLKPRESDQKIFIADISKAKQIIKWKPEISYKEGITKMIEWSKEQIK